MKFGQVLRTATAAAGALLCQALAAQTPAVQVASFSDTFAFEDPKLPLAFSC